jgi:hypothetical protein
MLNRPFKSVAELGAVFSGTPWRNLDFFTPESGSAALLDVFCVADATSSSSITAGKVNLNTRQALVLQSILSGAYKNHLSPATSVIDANGTATAALIAGNLVARTSDTLGNLGRGSGPLVNVADFVGKWISSAAVTGATVPFNISGANSYAGFSGLAATTASPLNTPPNLSYLLNQDAGTSAGYTTMVVQRYR